MRAVGVVVVGALLASVLLDLLHVPSPALFGGLAGGMVQGLGSSLPLAVPTRLTRLGQGLVGVTINYRLAPEVKWPAGREDTIAALLHVVQHAAEYGIDPQRIVLMGHSAGATHVADVVAAPGGAAGKFAGAIMSSGFYDLASAVRDPFKPQYYDMDDWGPMSALPGLLGSAAPCLFAVCELDMAECQQQTRTLVEAWFAAKGRLPVLHVQAGHNHISGARQIGSPLDSFGPVIADFVRSH